MLKIEWIGYFTPYGVNDSGFIQRRDGLAQEGGFTMLFNFTDGKVNVPALRNFSGTTATTYRIEDQSGNIENLVMEANQNYVNDWVATISPTATRIRFLYWYNSSPPQLFITPYIEIDTDYNKFFVNFKGEITYSNITDTW